MNEIKFKDWFKHTPDKVKFGVELECVLFDLTTKSPPSSNAQTDSILSEINSKNIYRDYYAWQLELKTTPTSDIDKSLKEMRILYKSAAKVFDKHNIMIIPMPNILSTSNTYCGMHIHFSFPDLEVSNYYNKAMGMYPFLLALADHAKNSEIQAANCSGRMSRSRHIGMPPLDRHSFRAPGSKFHDIHLSPPNKGESPARVKKPTTLEVRLFDTPSFFSMYKFLVEATVNLARYLRLDNPVVLRLKNDNNTMRNELSMTRELVESQKYGLNKVFKMSNENVCRELASYFSLDYPSETQFEYRQRAGLNYDINDYIRMAIEGDWL